MERSNPSVRVLLVEDNLADVKLVETLFKRCKTNFHISSVGDGEQAITYLESRAQSDDKSTPELIILDLNLPKMDGREVLSQIKANPQLRSIPVIVLTTSTSEEDVRKAYDLHANSFISKPAELNDFVQVINSIEAFWVQSATLPRA